MSFTGTRQTTTAGAHTSGAGGDDNFLRAENVSVKFGKRGKNEVQALSNVSLGIRRGRFVCFVGPSGCGKSTLLNVFAGLLRQTEGQVYFDGRELGGVNTGAGYITQHDTLLPWSTVESNIELALRVRGYGKAERKARVERALESVGLEGFRTLYPSQLSGGMRKRVLLARTLAYEPSLILMDEPYGALDAQMRQRLQTQLLETWSAGDKTIVFVTHDLDEALLLADEIVVFAARPGRIVYRTEVNLPRPRDLTSLRTDPGFGELWQDLWNRMDHTAQEDE
ncbi:ABC transporter ATP-binding protein [Streptosporangium sp. NPDC006930]|uniref:ABC transporter ATP-binding protein n=1 Tax=unclassified Streptosporangium TaxID=2632669 RepID=UPI003444790A